MALWILLIILWINQKYNIFSITIWFLIEWWEYIIMLVRKIIRVPDADLANSKLVSSKPILMHTVYLVICRYLLNLHQRKFTIQQTHAISQRKKHDQDRLAHLKDTGSITRINSWLSFRQRRYRLLEPQQSCLSRLKHLKNMVSMFSSQLLHLSERIYAIIQADTVCWCYKSLALQWGFWRCCSFCRYREEHIKIIQIQIRGMDILECRWPTCRFLPGLWPKPDSNNSESSGSHGSPEPTESKLSTSIQFHKWERSKQSNILINEWIYTCLIIIVNIVRIQNEW